MAEAAGLAIGTIALVGTFKDCIDVYGMIVAARSVTDDAEVLNTKLDVERMLLLQWADRVGMTEPERYDRRLDDPDLNRTVARTLGSIKNLLSDGKALRERYGLVNYQEETHTITFDDNLDAGAGSARLQKFIERFDRLHLPTGESSRSHSVATRFKWVVKDKEKFADLMNELSYFVSRLHNLVPAQNQPSRTMTEEDLSQIQSISHLKLVIKASTGSQPEIARIAQQAIRLHNQRRVLDRLWSRWMDDRKTNISDRHFRTLDWALKSKELTPKWDNLAKWLRIDSGLYWLAGKPGSGKSTLMKYLSNHSRTSSLLKEWTGQSELVTLQFFFYALGSPEQKSQEGILRSLLFQFLDKHRDLIEHVLPIMWREATITENKDQDLTMPPIAEMQGSLMRLAETVSTDRKFWVLIDGLDEFEGKHKTITEFLARLERLPNVKLMVSSRPLPVFVNAFELAPKMYLEDLTKNDIQAYVHDMIRAPPHMEQIAQIEKDLPMEIARILVRKASGVFLWIVLACRSIIEGLEDYETVPELMSRITELPSELDDLFSRIIAEVDPRNRDQCARLLRLVFESQKLLFERQNVLGFNSLPAIGLAIVEEQGLRADYMGPSVTGLSYEHLAPLCRMMKGRLRSRCSGLIEIHRIARHSHRSHHHVERRMIPVAVEDEVLVESGVRFMHRSLYEFLGTEGVWERDILRVDNEGGKFEPHLILASLWTQLAGLRAFDDVISHSTCFENALIHNAQADTAQCPPGLLATSLSRLEGVFAGYETASGRVEYFAKLCLPHQPKCRKTYENLSGGLAIAAEMGIVDLLQFALEEPEELRRRLIPPKTQNLQDSSNSPTCPKELYKLNGDHVGLQTHRGLLYPLLYHATCQPLLTMPGTDKRLLIFKFYESNITPTKAVKYLLKAGHDPNEEFFMFEGNSSTTPWLEWLLEVDRGWPNFAWGVEWLHQQAAITLLLVDAGAKIGAPGTERCRMVGNSLDRYIRAAQKSGRRSVVQARSDALWLKLRDRIQSLRSAASQQDAQS